MAEQVDKIEIGLSIQAAPKQVYDAFRNSRAIESWFANSANVQLQENGQFFLWWNDDSFYSAGMVTQVVENQSIQFEWHGNDEPVKSKVAIEIKPEIHGAKITLTHSCEQKGVVGNEHRKGWEHFLGNLKSVLETGKDLRIFTRPMMGVFVDQAVDTELAGKLNLPEVKGILISGVIDGMGAQAADIRANDIFVEMNGHELKGYADFPLALKGKLAGDEVTVTLFRGPETIKKTMVLSTREEPKGLSDRDAFVETLDTEYADVNRQLDALFDGVTDEQASIHPAEGEWNAKEVLSHILYSEHWGHQAIAAVLNDLPPPGFNNMNSLMSATAKNYSLTELLREIKIAEQITIDTIRHLPDETIQDKRKFGQMVMFFSPGNASHTLTHFDQIKEALNM